MLSAVEDMEQLKLCMKLYNHTGKLEESAKMKHAYPLTWPSNSQDKWVCMAPEDVYSSPIPNNQELPKDSTVYYEVRMEKWVVLCSCNRRVYKENATGNFNASRKHVEWMPDNKTVHMFGSQKYKKSKLIYVAKSGFP